MEVIPFSFAHDRTHSTFLLTSHRILVIVVKTDYVGSSERKERDVLFKVGDKVRSAFFGAGTVTSIIHSEFDHQVWVKFDDYPSSNAVSFSISGKYTFNTAREFSVYNIYLEE